MPYGLGIDLGTSCTVAAISRIGTGSAVPEIVALGVDKPGMPTVLHCADDGTVLVGAAAEALVLRDPERVFRGFLHRGTGAAGVDAQWLSAQVVRSVVDAVTAREGGPPQRITLAHSPAWGPDECHLLAEALDQVDLPDVALVPAPVAAAEACLAGGGAAGVPVAVYDLGATFCASVLRRAGNGFALLPGAVLAGGGGARFDELVLEWVLDELGEQVAVADLDDHAVLAGMAGLVTNCVAAREALGARTEVTIPVSLPGLDTAVRLSRGELASLVEPTLRDTVAALRSALSAANVTPAAVGTVLVIGGCTAMPQVTRLLTAELGRPVTVPADPALAVARGAAVLAAPVPSTVVLAGPGTAALAGPGTAPLPVSPAEPGLALLAESLGFPASSAFPASPAPPAVPADQPVAAARSARRTRTPLAVAAGFLAVAAVVIPLTLLDGTGSRAEPSETASEHGEFGSPGGRDQAPANGGAGAGRAPTSDRTATTEAIRLPASTPGAPATRTGTRPTTGPAPRQPTVPATSSTSPAPTPSPTLTPTPTPTTTSTSTPTPTSTPTSSPTSTTTPPPPPESSVPDPGTGE
jgi:molecular chaperone DnaK